MALLLASEVYHVLGSVATPEKVELAQMGLYLVYPWEQSSSSPKERFVLLGMILMAELKIKKCYLNSGLYCFKRLFWEEKK